MIDHGNKLHIERLKKSLEEINSIRSTRKNAHDPDLQTWKDRTKQSLRNIFGPEHDYYRRFVNLSFWEMRFIMGKQVWTGEDQRTFEEDLEKAEAILNDALEEIGIQYETESLQEKPQEYLGPIEVIENILKRFHIVVNQLQQRHQNRGTLQITDEYDVQDLLHALLKIYFYDIRSEEWTPSYAGGSSRMDFLLKKEKIVIEVKKTREGLKDKEIGNQLLEDIGRYRVHPDCNWLICFVYDPEMLLKNPNGLERDLSGSVNDKNVKLIIFPKGQ